MMSRMKESHRKGVVTHPDLESCTASREALGAKRRQGHGQAGYGAVKEKLQGVDSITNGEDHTEESASTKLSGGPAQSETPRTSGNIMHENRETWSASAAQSGGRPVGEGDSRTTHRGAGQESDSGVVPMKGSNQGGQPTAESLEGRPGTKENDRQPHMRPTQGGSRMSQGLEGGTREPRLSVGGEPHHFVLIAVLRESEELGEGRIENAERVRKQGAALYVDGFRSRDPT